MEKQTQKVVGFYKDQSVINELALTEVVNASPFTTLVGSDKGTEMDLYEKLSYLAGIKMGPMLNSDPELNTNSIDELVASARNAGYEIEIYNA